MTLREKLAEAREELAQVKDAVENGEKGAPELSEAIQAVKAIQADVDAADEAQELIKSLGSNEGPADAEGNVKKAKSLGEHFVKFAEGKMRRGEKFAVTAPMYGAKEGTATPRVQVNPTGDYAQTLTTVDPNIRDAHREQLFMADLFSQAPVTNGNSVTYFVEDETIAGDFAAVGENGEKPQISFADPIEKSETLKKIAGYYKVSDEVLEDSPRLAAHINGRALYRYNSVEDSQLLNGSGTGNNILGLLNVSGIQATTYAKNSDVDPDILLDAIDAIANATDFEADAIIMNRSDYNKMLKLKDKNDRYLAGGPFGDFLKHPPIWGVPVYTTSKIARGTVLVGAFKEGGTVYRKNGMQVSVYNQNEDDAIHNRVTIVVEGRLTLGVEYPAAFVKITEATA